MTSERRYIVAPVALAGSLHRAGMINAIFAWSQSETQRIMNRRPGKERVIYDDGLVRVVLERGEYTFRWLYVKTKRGEWYGLGYIKRGVPTKKVVEFVEEVSE